MHTCFKDLRFTLVQQDHRSGFKKTAAIPDTNHDLLKETELCSTLLSTIYSENECAVVRHMTNYKYSTADWRFRNLRFC